MGRTVISFIYSPDRSRNAPHFPHKIPFDSFSIADFSAKYNGSDGAGQRTQHFDAEAAQAGLLFPQQGHRGRLFRRVGVAADDDLLLFYGRNLSEKDRL